MLVLMSKARFNNFSTGEPPSDVLLDLLCEDAGGKYVVPFPCVWKGGAYWNPKSQNDSRPLEAKVVGWKLCHKT
jgi:hypothetical protein